MLINKICCAMGGHRYYAKDTTREDVTDYAIRITLKCSVCGKTSCYWILGGEQFMIKINENGKCQILKGWNDA